MIWFEWHAFKARDNLRDHGISFEDAKQVFADPFAISVQDRIEGGERRWQTIGMAADILMVLLVAHTWEEKKGDEVIRIISARKATRKEQRMYAQARS
jgi:uncharacterized DUF497 family protein